MRIPELNREMVRTQMAARGVRSRRVLGAFLRVDRALFVQERYASMAYSDTPLPIGGGQTISQPYMVALMLEALSARRGMKALEVGSGSGYVLALLSAMGLEAFGVEIRTELAETTKGRLTAAGFTARCFAGDGGEGLPDEAPFERILVSAACSVVPPPLFEQLDEGGVLVAPVDAGYSSVLKRFVKGAEGNIEEEKLGGCVFVPLTGRYGR